MAKSLVAGIRRCRQVAREISYIFAVCAILLSQNLDLQAAKCTLARCAILSDRTRQEMQNPDPTWYNPHP